MCCYWLGLKRLTNRGQKGLALCGSKPTLYVIVRTGLQKTLNGQGCVHKGEHQYWGDGNLQEPHKRRRSKTMLMGLQLSVGAGDCPGLQKYGAF